MFNYFVQGRFPGRGGMASTTAQLSRADRRPSLPGGSGLHHHQLSQPRPRSHWLEEAQRRRGPSSFEVLGLKLRSCGRADFLRRRASLGDAKHCSIWQEPSACLRNLELEEFGLTVMAGSRDAGREHAPTASRFQERLPSGMMEPFLHHPTQLTPSKDQRMACLFLPL